jgi:uncharacterized caspase-like protein
MTPVQLRFRERLIDRTPFDRNAFERVEASMLKSLATCLIGLAAFAAAFTPAAAEKRVALVIGNAAYQNAPRLQNPSNDATDIAAKLRGLDFEVIEGIDLGKRDMEKRIRAFAEALSSADVALFYYAGHGLQVDQRNFLAPIDAQLKSETDLDFEAVQLDLVLKQMVRNARTSIVFLDACRDNPLAANLAQVSRSLDVGRGLARLEAAASMMVVYSTEPGKVALDGTGRNSPFTAALLRHIDSEGESISDMMIEVRNDVLKETGGKQRPFESASLTGQFYFKPAPVPAPGEASASTADQIASLREEIARLQAVQGQLVKSQQEQLASLQQKLADKTKAPNTPSPSASRVIAVEPAEGSAPPQSAPASGSTPSPAADTQGSSTKVAAADSKGTEENAAAPNEVEAPLPEEATRQELAQDILSELKRLGCYFGSINGNWSGRSKRALERFNRVSALDLPLDDPEQASLDALKDWKGAHCPIEARVKAHRPAAAAAPKKRASPPRKAVTAVPPPRAPSAVRPSPAPRRGTAEQNELKRLFPSTAWPE